MVTWGEGLYIFREVGSTDNYVREAGEQAHTFVDLGSTAKGEENREKNQGFGGDQSIIFRDQGNTDRPVGTSKLAHIQFDNSSNCRHYLN